MRSRDREPENLRCNNSGQDDSARSQRHMQTLGKWPFPIAEVIRVLGVDLDPKLSFTAHTTPIANIAKIRVGIISRLPGCTWGAETGVPQLISKSLVITPLRYALAMVGSVAYEQLLGALDTRVMNTLARKMCGVACTARVPMLQANAGLLSIRNLYPQHCVAIVD